MFVNTLPIIFLYTTLATLAELFVIVLGLFSVIYISTPDPDHHWQYQRHAFSFRDYLFQSWTGNMPLWKIFWPYFLLLNTALLLFDHLVKNGMISVSSWDTLHVILFTPSIWWGGALWRCSDKTGHRLWGACVRLMIAAVVFESLLKIGIRIKYPQIFFECQERLLDFVTCF